jgi:TDG/mug DNA glycosylase family protein
MTTPPTRAALLAARKKTVPDVIAPRLRVLFCGINPGLYSGATGHHFARPGNRFWSTLYRAGFTERLLAPSEERALLQYKLGVTNLVARTTAAADELTKLELTKGRRRLLVKIKRYQPRIVAVLGVGAFRTAFGRPKATIGLQQKLLGSTAIWVLPNPSGLNAHYQMPELVRIFRALRKAAES